MAAEVKATRCIMITQCRLTCLFWQMKYLLLVSMVTLKVTPERLYITKGHIFSVSSWWAEVSALPGPPHQRPGKNLGLMSIVLSTVHCWLLTCLRPLWVRAEHSRYLTDRILLASFCPCSLLMGEWPLSARACRASLSSLRSILVPANISSVSLCWLSSLSLPINSMGASGQWCLISGHHFEVTFSKEEGLTTEKQMRKTSVCG